MAVMIPEKPNMFHPGSLEDIMFESLKKLSDDYMVFHSFRITKVKSGIIHESETDFVIFHRKKGILCLEAKAGSVSYRDGRWIYGNGELMHNGGPFNQAAANKWRLMELISDSSLRQIVNRIKFLHGVWFPSLSETEIDAIILPPEGDRALILGKEALEDPAQYVEGLFSLNIYSEVVTDISEKETCRLIREVLCPEFNIFPPMGFGIELKHMVFHRMLNEQAGILNFLSEQRTAVINGAAGTGKTLIAVEKAHRHAMNGQKVLFLCYNAELRKYLASSNENELIDFMTVDGYVCRLCRTPIANYAKAKKKLMDYAAFGNFPYRHVIVDEGQDFGRDEIEEIEILQMLHDVVMEETDPESSFYVFYDRLQTVQSSRLPEFIEMADCKLMLYRNCRNTGNVSRTAMSLMEDDKRKLLLRDIGGKIPRLHFCTALELQKKVVDNAIDELNETGINDIVILTFETEQKSFMESEVDGGMYRKCRFTSCRKFKGLESDAIILVDFTEQTLLRTPFLFYVGASRARIRLEIVTDMDNARCRNLLEKISDKKDVRRPMRELASLLNCTAILH